MKNKPDAFEQSLRQSLEHFEVPYNSADWAHLDRELAKSDAKHGRWSLGLLALLFGGTVALSATLYQVLSVDGSANFAPIEHAESTTHATESANSASLAEESLTEVSAIAASPSASELKQAVKEFEGLAETKAASTKASSSGNPKTPSNPTPADELAPVKPTAASSTEVSIRPSVTQGCPGTSVEFEVANLASPGTRMLWNFGDGSFSTETTPKHAYNKAGRYEVTLSMSSATGGTIFNKPVSDVIVIHERPEAAFNPMLQEYLDRVPSVHFENKSLKGSTYHWDFGDGNSSKLQVPTHVYKKKGDYTVSLTVTNAIGCTDRTERMVRIKEDYNLLAAPAFSPNGDGVEESFIPDALKSLDRRFRMTIVDPATGALVYETNDVKRPWNGRLNGVGNPCPTGDYVWMVEMKDGAALGGTYTGTVSLLR
ncbi:MAG TPA: PKD domain-containing protein [Flavobacteriales bacterium]|nr:PKD domain-containing protein [Flavobacteriales bacterium]